MKGGRLTCRALVDGYLKRIDAFDKNGPGINAIVQLNPAAQQQADDLDRRYAQGGFVGPLHCVPAIVKDNFETIGLQTAAGSLALKGYVPLHDAFQVQRIKAAGAIVLAKSNMAEFAFSPYETVNSVLPGYTRNPYALDRVTAGSSGGTAAAVAANLGEVGLGTDTGNSIRGPSSHNALVGIRSTMGLTSRAGVVPLSLFQDVAGPMARTVADAVAVFQVVAGYDPDDPATEAARSHTIPNYSTSLVRDGLRGVRLGVLRQAYERPTLDSEVAQVFARAVSDLRRAGATVLDTVAVTQLDSIMRSGRGGCNVFKFELNRWLEAQGDRVPVKNLDAIIRSGQFHPGIQRRLEMAQAVQQSPDSSPGCQARQRTRDAFRAAVTRLMDSLRLDALVYPTWSNVPRLIGDLNTPHGNNSARLSPPTGFPAITVPMGFAYDTFPAGLQILGRLWSEPTLIKIAYAYEQATLHRRPPPHTPALAKRP